MKHLSTFFRAAGATLALVPTQVFAATNPFDTAKNLTGNVAGEAGISTSKGLPEIVGSIINVALGFLGIVFLVLLLYAGFLWMTAQGDSKKVDKARDMIIQSVIGLVIIVAAFAISNFVLSSLVNVTQ